MKRLLALAALVAVPVLATAMPRHWGDKRQRDPREKTAAGMAERLKTQLKLNDGQAAKVREILEKSLPERAELEKKLHEQERRAHEQIRALLDDDQKEAFDMMRAGGQSRGAEAERSGNHEGGMGGMGPRGGMGRMGGRMGGPPREGSGGSDDPGAQGDDGPPPEDGGPRGEGD